MSYLLDLAGVRVIQEEGEELATSAKLNFGPGIVASYNSATKTVDVYADGGAVAGVTTTTPVPSVTTAPGWATLTAFYVGQTGTGILEAISQAAADAEREITVRVTDDEQVPIADAEVVHDEDLNRSASASFELVGPAIYLIQAQCVGGEGAADFASIYRAVVIFGAS